MKKEPTQKYDEIMKPDPPTSEPMSMDLDIRPIKPEDIVFKIKEKEILRLTTEGFIYKSKLIEDAGEARKIFMEVMLQMKEEIP